MSVPNQKKILIERTSANAKKDYLKVSNENLQLAMYNLKANSFKLWVYFVDNADGYKFDLYPVDFCTKAGVSDGTYRRAFEELEEKGYLRESQKPDYKNVYLFSETGDITKIKKPDIVNSIDTDSFEDLKKKLF